MTMKDDPLQQSTISDQVREQMSKRTLWLNASNFEEMVEASYEGLSASMRDDLDMMAHGDHGPAVWRAMCAAAIAVVEWRLGGRVRP